MQATYKPSSVEICSLLTKGYWAQIDFYVFEQLVTLTLIHSYLNMQTQIPSAGKIPYISKFCWNSSLLTKSLVSRNRFFYIW